MKNEIENYLQDLQDLRRNLRRRNLKMLKNKKETMYRYSSCKK